MGATSSNGRESGIRSIALMGVTRGQVKRLPGFDKSRHTVPKWASDRAQQFLGSICRLELEDWGEALFAELREAMGYKRRDMSLSVGEGQAELRSKDFVLKRRYLLDESALSEYQLETELSEASSADLLEYPEFNDAVGPLFDQLRCLFNREQTVEEVIDAIEEAEESGVSVDYPSSCESCEARIEGLDASFIFDSASAIVKVPRFCSPGELVRAVDELGDALARHEGLRERIPLPFTR